MMVSEIFELAGAYFWGNPVFLGIFIIIIIAMFLFLFRTPLNVSVMMLMLVGLVMPYFHPTFMSVGVLALVVGGGVIFYGLFLIIASK